MNKPRKNRFICNLTDSVSVRLTDKAITECREEEKLNTQQLYWFTQMSYIQSHLCLLYTSDAADE